MLDNEFYGTQAAWTLLLPPTPPPPPNGHELRNLVCFGKPLRLTQHDATKDLTFCIARQLIVANAHCWKRPLRTAPRDLDRLPSGILVMWLRDAKRSIQFFKSKSKYRRRWGIYLITNPLHLTWRYLEALKKPYPHTTQPCSQSWVRGAWMCLACLGCLHGSCQSRLLFDICLPQELLLTGAQSILQLLPELQEPQDHWTADFCSKNDHHWSSNSAAEKLVYCYWLDVLLVSIVQRKYANYSENL